MYKPLIAFLIVFFILSGFLLMFTSGGKKKIDNKQVTVDNTNTNTNTNYNIDNVDNPDIFRKKENTLPANKGEKEMVTFNILDKPRDDAQSHNMDEKYFVKIKESEYDFIDKDTQERMRVLVNAKLMSKKRHRKYDED